MEWRGLPDPGPTADAVRLILGPEARDTMPLVPGIYGAVNYHFYPAFSDRCPYEPQVPADTLDPQWLDRQLENLDYMTALRDRYNPGAPIWLGETGSAACGGQVGYSDRHAATFFFLNQLGQLARRGVRVLVRQALEGGTYGLLEQGTLRPNPDYWAALLWRRLMGTEQLAPAAAGGAPDLRLFASCTPDRAGSVTLSRSTSRAPSGAWCVCAAGARGGHSCTWSPLPTSSRVACCSTVANWRHPTVWCQCCDR
ncbi:hypothetical protein [Thermoleophilum album]|uniref:hypothetical protein n=1 Tax=Thermoleophilum album TaxID=29539 RepID=UPI00115F9C5F|nr:hypothetical protein [Thermoleophilum album]